MKPNRYVVFEDHFSGAQPSIERYSIFDLYGSAIHAADGYSAESGALLLSSERNQGDFSIVTTADPLQFALSKESIMRARFRLSSDDACRLYLGFALDRYNFINLSFDTDLANGGIALVSNAATTYTRDYSPTVMDASWHTMELRLLGTGNGAECVLDGDEANKMEIANSALPSNDQYGAFCYIETRGSSGLGIGEERGLYLSYWQATQLR